jgi:transglutaminase-like putative cysteine protease
VLEPYLRPATEDADENYLGWIRRFTSGDRLALDVLHDINRTIHAVFAYGARFEEGVQAPSQTVASQSGTCRDFAWLMIETCRRMGFAARFVTGYLFSPGADIRGAGATHAWCEVFLPVVGWIAFDPTNGLAESPDLIRVAATRTPDEASPMSGSIIGHATSTMTVRVDVDQADFAPDGQMGVQVGVNAM